MFKERLILTNNKNKLMKTLIFSSQEILYPLNYEPN